MNRRFFLRSLGSWSSLLTGSAALAAPASLLARDDGNIATSSNTAIARDDDRKKKSLKADRADRKRLMFPAGLKKGSTVGVVAPASGISREEINAGVRSLEALGLNVVLGKSIYRGSAGFLAAADEVRAAEFMEFIERKDIDAIITARGGYGVMRILPMLDYETIRDNPKIIMGYSDITALVNTIFARSNMIAFHGPVAAGEMDEYTRDSFVKTLFVPNPEAASDKPSEQHTPSKEAPAPSSTPNSSSDKKVSAKNSSAKQPSKKQTAAKQASTKKQSAKTTSKTTTSKTITSKASAKQTSKHTAKQQTKQKAKQHTKQQSHPVAAQLASEPIHYTDPALVNYGTTGTAGKAEGRLVGGNLTIVCALLGTPFEIQTADRILFLEEVNEEPYRVDRMLTQLWLASKLQQCAGIVLGKFSKSEASNEFNPSYNLDEVLRSRLEPLGIPVVAGFQFGHVKSKCTLPVGALAEIDADAKKLTILERPVAFPEGW
jgi:muramoyltetrapeptide carboxypeptidase LdcA involved in peptidoglycan recycling